MTLSILKHIGRTALASAALLLASGAAHAQSPRLYSTPQGLSSTRIHDVTFDRNHFMWISTTSGLVQFNGQSFTAYRAESGTPWTLQTNRVNCLYEDGASRHWVGATDGLYYFCRTENKFTHYYMTADSLAQSVSCIVSHPLNPNRLIVSTYGWGVYVFDAERREVVEGEGERISGNLKRYNVQQMLVDEHRNLWLLHPWGLRVVSLDNYRTVRLRGPQQLVDDLQETMAVHSVCSDHGRHCLWLGTAKHGLLRCDLATMKVSRVDDAQLNRSDITALCIDADGRLLVGTENSGLFRFHPEEGQLTGLHYLNCPVDLERSKIHHILYDDQQNLWLSLYQKGLLVIPRQDNIFTFRTAGPSAEMPSTGAVRAFAVLGTGERLTAMDGGGLVVNHPSHAPQGPAVFTTANSPLLTNSLMALAAAGERAYVGTYGFGLYVYEGGRIVREPALSHLDRTPVMALAYDAARRLLYIGTNGEGVWAYDEAQRTCRRLGGMRQGAYNPWTITLAHSDATGLWLGTEGGIYRYAEAADSLCQVRTQDDGSSPRAVSFVPMGDTCVWCATEVGLLRYDDATGALVRLDGDAPAEDEYMSMVADPRGRLWFATSHGIGFYEPAVGRFVSYRNAEISLAGNFSLGASLYVPDGRILFGGDNGTIRFDPETVTHAGRTLKEIIFTRLWVNNEPTDYVPNRRDNCLDAALWFAKTLTLPADQNSFSIGFASQEYGNPFSIRYAYRLEGYEDAWHEAHGSDVMANYSSLPGGHYRLQVRAFADDNMERSLADADWRPSKSATFKQLTVIVLRPWYAQWWAYLLYALLAAAAVWAVVTYFRNRAHQRRVLERTRHNQQIKEAKLRLFTSISHDLKTPLTLIISPLRRLMERKDHDRATQKVYELMYRNALRILMLINQQMDIRRLDNGQLRLHMQPLDVEAFLGEIMRYFAHAASAHHIDFVLRVAKPLRGQGAALGLWGDPEQLDKVVFNLLSNAFKYVPNEGIVRVEVRAVDNAAAGGARCLPLEGVDRVLEISIFNSGSALDTADAGRIFERFYQGRNAQSAAGTGIGLNLARELTELHHGTLSAENVLSADPETGASPTVEGVRFVILLPLGDAHLTEAEKQRAAATEGDEATAGAMMQDIDATRQDLTAAAATADDDDVPLAMAADAPAEEDAPAADAPTEVSADADAAPGAAEASAGEVEVAASEPAAPAADVASSDRPTSGPRNKARAITVLLVDDEPDMLDYLSSELSDYTVITARSGNEAWASLLAGAPDVVVTDIRMEGGDGLELCRRIKGNPDTLRLPVIVLTGEVGEEMHAEVLQLQADHYLTKPVNIQLLRSAIRQTVKTRADLKNRSRRSEMGFDYDQKQMASPDQQLLARVTEAIQRHLDDSEYSVDQLAAECGLSRVHLNRKLKELVGTSPSALIKQARLKQAAILLVNSDVTIAEIAYTCGFSSPSYFTQNFTNYFSMTPKEFIANYQSNPNDEKLRKLLD